jgi:recombination protein RecA
VKEWVSTGSTILDLAISNRKNGGFPVGRVCEITGLEQSGKSLLAAHTLLNTQKKGGLAVYIDTENALSTEFLSAIGLNLKEMLYIPLETVEDIFETVETIIEKVRSSDKNRLVTIVVDSIAGASTKTEMAADFDKDGYATAKALIISKAMRKITNLIGRERICLIFTNQLRQKLNAPAFSDPWTTPGGKGIPFHASVRIRLSSIGAIKAKVNGQDTIVGSRVKAKLVKNRCGPPLREAEYAVYFDSGIDDYGSWLETMKDYNLVRQSGAWYEWTDQTTGEIIKFQSKDFVSKIISNPEYKEVVYDSIAEKVVMQYQKTDEVRIDDVSITDEPLLDEV